MKKWIERVIFTFLVSVTLVWGGTQLNIATQVQGLGAGIATALGSDASGSGNVCLNNGCALVGTNITGTAASLVSGGASNVVGKTQWGVLYQSSSNVTASLSPAPSGYILTASGAAAPVWAAAPNASAMMTPQAASGTSVTFTGIPSWATKVYIGFNGVGTNGTSEKYLRVGSGSIASSGYLGNRGTVVTNSAGNDAPITNAFGLYSVVTADRLSGQITLIELDPTNFIWSVQGIYGATQTSQSYITSGSVTLSGALDRVSITTANGTDGFVAGSVGVTYQ